MHRHPRTHTRHTTIYLNEFSENEPSHRSQNADSGMWLQRARERWGEGERGERESQREARGGRVCVREREETRKSETRESIHSGRWVNLFVFIVVMCVCCVWTSVNKCEWLLCFNKLVTICRLVDEMIKLSKSFEIALTAFSRFTNYQ